MDRIVRQISLALMVSASLTHSEAALTRQYGVPGNFAGNNDRAGQGGQNGQGHSYDGGNGIDQDYVDDQPKSYEFGYAVKDAVTGNDFGRRETSDGETVRGEYRVQLPDGRIQIVSYTADWRTGFHADVRYEGTATYPAERTNNGPGRGFDYRGGNNAGPGGVNQGNNGAYPGNYQPASGNYNGGKNLQRHRFDSNSIDNSYDNIGGVSRNNYGNGIPSPTYGPSFR